MIYSENDHEHISLIQACFRERDKNLNIFHFKIRIMSNNLERKNLEKNNLEKKNLENVTRFFDHMWDATDCFFFIFTLNELM